MEERKGKVEAWVCDVDPGIRKKQVRKKDIEQKLWCWRSTLPIQSTLRVMEGELVNLGYAIMKLVFL